MHIPFFLGLRHTVVPMVKSAVETKRFVKRRTPESLARKDNDPEQKNKILN